MHYYPWAHTGPLKPWMKRCKLFLLAFLSNYVPILHRFWDMARFCRKSPIWTNPTSIWHPRSGWLCWNFAEILGIRKLESTCNESQKVIIVRGHLTACKIKNIKRRIDKAVLSNTHAGSVALLQLALVTNPVSSQVHTWLTKIRHLKITRTLSCKLSTQLTGFMLIAKTAA